jgi:hypothetical protein
MKIIAGHDFSRFPVHLLCVELDGVILGPDHEDSREILEYESPFASIRITRAARIFAPNFRAPQFVVRVPLVRCSSTSAPCRRVAVLFHSVQPSRGANGTIPG